MTQEDVVRPEELSERPDQPTLDPSVSFPDYAIFTKTRPQPGWITLNAARERGFTGEIVFETSPRIRAYLDAGNAYYAERDDQQPLGRRLVDAGVIDSAQLDRGTVRVGDVQHLGRLFDRDPSVDRDAVLVAVEAETEMLVTQLAHDVTCSIGIHAFRHHESGIHRWFVAAPQTPLMRRPVSDVNQVDRSVVEDLPSLAPPVRISWDQPELPEPGRPMPPPDVAPLDPPVAPGATEASAAPPERSDMPSATRSADADRPSEEPSSTATPSDEEWLERFQIVWPDGSEEPAGIDGPDLSTDVQEGPDLDPAEPPAGDDAAPPATEFSTEDVRPAPAAGPDTELDDIMRLAALVGDEEPSPTTEASTPEPAPGPTTPVPQAPERADSDDAAHGIAPPPPEPESTAPAPEPISPPVAAAPTEADLQPTEAAPGEPDAEVVPTEAVVADPAPDSEPSTPPVGTAARATEEETAPGAPALPPPATMAPVRFEMPSLVVSEAPRPDAAVPDDVADAVRRALRAIENASTETPASLPSFRLASIEMSDLEVGDVPAAVQPAADLPAPAVADASPAEAAVPPGLAVEEANRVPGPPPAEPPADAAPVPAQVDTTPDVPAPTPTVASTPSPAGGAFAPPTMDTRAEVMYARFEAEHAEAEAQASAVPEPGQASVVFIDEDVEEGVEEADDERVGALRRLIGSLRRR